MRRFAALLISAFALLATSADAQPPAKQDEDDLPKDRIVALDPRWSAAFETPPAAPAGFDEVAAYVPLTGGELVAVDLERGDIRWKVELTTAFTPVTGDGLVFAAGDRLVIAFDQRTGRTVWRTPVDAELAMAPLWDSGWLLVSTAAGDVLALRAEDGKIVWREKLSSKLSLPPALADDRLYIVLEDGGVEALELATGKRVWRSPLRQTVISLAAFNDQLIVGTRENWLNSLDPKRGRVRWAFRIGSDVRGAAVADDERIYFVAMDNLVRAVDRDNGNLEWMKPLPFRPAGGPLRAADVVFVPLVSADIATFTAATGAPTFTIRAAGELGGAPFLREMARPTAPRLIAISREGTLQGFAPRIDPVPEAVGELPGVKVAH